MLFEPWMNLGNMLCEKKNSRERPQTLWSHLHEASGIGRSKERKKSRSVAAGAGRAWRKTETHCKGGRAVFESHENALTLTVLTVVPPYQYTKNHRFVHLKPVNCVTCELYLNKAVTKNTHTDTRT